MAQAFVNSKIQPGKVVVFIKPTCPFCRKTQELLSQLPFKEGLLEFVDITATSDTNEIQDYLQQLTGARTGMPLPSSRTPLGLRHSRQREGCVGRGRVPERRHCFLERVAGLQPKVLSDQRTEHS
uniref:Glutaredoxin-1 n=1 Tax=Sus scrofa TaxID=9823 RepID=A0A8W4FAC4_PIG